MLESCARPCLPFFAEKGTDALMTTAPVPSSPPLLSEIRQAPPRLASTPGASLLTAGKLRLWGTKSAFSLVDQGFTSLTGFCVSFLLARWLPANVYGAYAIAFAAYLFVCGFHNVMLLEPMSILGPARHSARLSHYFRAQIAVHAVLAGALSGAAMLVAAVIWRFAPHGPLAGAILGAALALPFLLFLWLARRMCYVLQRPRIAILGSSSCLVIVLLGLFGLRHLDWLTPFWAFVLLGVGSLLGSCLVVRRVQGGIRDVPSLAPISWRSALRENWSYGRWLVGTAILYPISGQVQMFLVAAFLGLGSAGVLRAMMLPAAVMTQVVSATDLLILPGFSYDFGRGFLRRMRQKAILASCALGTAGLCFAGLLRFIAVPAEHFLFRGKFASYVGLMPILALIPAANGFNSGLSAALRGSQRPHFDLLANAVAAPVAVLSAVAFIRWWGLAGAAASLVTGFACLAIVNFCSYLHLLAPLPHREARATQPAFSLGKE
jgi:O-antigen/teichoic acid export membrane protein